MLRELAILLFTSCLHSSHADVQSTTPSQITVSTTSPSQITSTLRPYYAVPVGAKTVTIDGQQYASQYQPLLQSSPNILYGRVENSPDVNYLPAVENYGDRGSVSRQGLEAFNTGTSTPRSYVSVTSHPPSASYVVRNQAVVRNQPVTEVKIQSRPSIQYAQTSADYHQPLVKARLVNIEVPNAPKAVESYRPVISVYPPYAPPAVTPESVGNVQGQNIQIQKNSQHPYVNYQYLNYVQKPVGTANHVYVKSEAAPPPVSLQSSPDAVEVPEEYVKHVSQVQNVVNTPVVNIQSPSVQYVKPAVVKTVVQPEKKVTVKQYASVTTHPPPAAYAKPTYNEIKTVQLQAPQEVSVPQVRYIKNTVAAKTVDSGYNPTPVFVRYYSSAPQRIAVPVQYGQEELNQIQSQQFRVPSLTKSSQRIPVPVEYPQVVQYQAATPIVHANSVVEKVYTPVLSQPLRHVASTPGPVFAKAVAYSPAASVSRVSFNGLGVNYGW